MKFVVFKIMNPFIYRRFVSFFDFRLGPGWDPLTPSLRRNGRGSSWGRDFGGPGSGFQVPQHKDPRWAAGSSEGGERVCVCVWSELRGGGFPFTKNSRQGPGRPRSLAPP